MTLGDSNEAVLCEIYLKRFDLGHGNGDSPLQY